MGESKPQQLTKSRATIDKEPHFNARRGAKRLETADILPNCVQGGAKRNSPVASQWFERLKIVPEMQKIACFQAIFLVSTLLLTYVRKRIF